MRAYESLGNRTHVLKFPSSGSVKKSSGASERAHSFMKISTLKTTDVMIEIEFTKLIIAGGA